jgi:hypothetical protein
LDPANLLPRTGTKHLAGLRTSGTPFLVLLVLPPFACVSLSARASDAAAAPAEASATVPADAAPGLTTSAQAAGAGSQTHPESYGPPGETPGIPPDAELEAAHAVVGKVILDNQNIFDLNNPKDDTWLFRLADRLHYRTRANVIRRQLLFKPGQPYSRRLVDESERILRADGYFYDAWIRPVAYHDGQVDLRVTTKDVWTINPGFNYGRSGGTSSTGVQLQDTDVLGSGADLLLLHSANIDRTGNQVGLSDQHLLGSFVSFGANYGNFSDGHLRELTVQQPFYSLDTPWAAGVYGINDVQTDSLWDRGAIIDQFRDLHQGAQIYGGLSSGLQNGWVHRWSAGVTYDEHQFQPVSTWTGPTAIPEDRRFVWPWVQFDLVQDDFLRLVDHDQIARTEDFYLGTSFSARMGWADSAYGSSQSALIFQSNASRGFMNGGSTLLLYWDFSGRITDGRLYNGLMDGSVRYYVEQSKNWLFFSTVVATKGWRLDLDDQILLGGDNGLRGYPLRYQDGTGRALVTIEQRYFTDWYPFRLVRVGGAIFFDSGRVWGEAPLAPANLGLLKDAGFGLRLGNARSGLGNVVHIDIAFPFNGATGINKVQFLVQTQAHF